MDKNKDIEDKSNAYAKSVGDDCLCKRTAPYTYYGEHIYCFCGCNIAEAFLAGYVSALEGQLKNGQGE